MSNVYFKVFLSTWINKDDDTVEKLIEVVVSLSEVV